MPVPLIARCVALASDGALSDDGWTLCFTRMGLRNDDAASNGAMPWRGCG